MPRRLSDAGRDPIFVSEDGRFVPTELARGPWDPESLHGGAPAGLIAREIERTAEGELFLARLSVEFLGPGPLAPLEVTTEVLRPGRRMQLVGAALRAGDRYLCRATAVRIRRTEQPLTQATEREPAPPGPDGIETDAASPAAYAPTFADAFEQRFVTGGYAEPGPATVWMRLRVPLVDHEEPSPLVRAVAAADFGNGVSSALDWATHVFVNPDLTVYLDRPVEGEWVCLEARTRIDPHGTGNAESALYDAAGRVGRSLQSLYVDRRDRG